MQGRNRDTDVDNKLMDTKGGKPRWGGGGGVMNCSIGIDMYTLMCIKLMTNKSLLYLKRKEKRKKPEPRGLGEGWTGRLGLADVSYYIWNG